MRYFFKVAEVKEVILKLADLVIEVKSRFKYTYDMCFDYLYNGDEKPVFTTFATNEQIIEERKSSPGFGDDVIENTCIYRNICNEILRYNAIFIHSAAISVDNKAYLFSANSGTGKTTHMNLWLEKFGNRAFVINGDKPILRLIDNTIYVYGTPWCGKEGLNKNVRIPFEAFYILERSLQNKIRKAESKEAVLALISQTTLPKKSDLMELMLSNIDTMVEKSKIFALGCNMEREACDVAYNASVEL